MTLGRKGASTLADRKMELNSIAASINSWLAGIETTVVPSSALKASSISRIEGTVLSSKPSAFSGTPPDADK